MELGPLTPWPTSDVMLTTMKRIMTAILKALSRHILSHLFLVNQPIRKIIIPTSQMRKLNFPGTLDRIYKMRHKYRHI